MQRGVETGPLTRRQQRLLCAGNGVGSRVSGDGIRCEDMNDVSRPTPCLVPRDKTSRAQAKCDIRRLGMDALHSHITACNIEENSEKSNSLYDKTARVTTFLLALIALAYVSYSIWQQSSVTWTTAILGGWACLRLRRSLFSSNDGTSNNVASKSTKTTKSKHKAKGGVLEWLLGSAGAGNDPCFHFKLLNRRMHDDVDKLNELLCTPQLYFERQENDEYDEAELSDKDVLVYDSARIPVDAPRAFVFSFEGDGTASQVEQLRQFVTLVVGVARPSQDRVILLLDSPGGEVSAYGLAAAQVTRLRDANIDVVTCVDRCAASGGYMMCAPSTYILAAPFAWIGSIGVVCETANVHRLLKHHHVDYHQFTAGKHKRTVTLMGPVTEAGIQHLQEQMNKIHRQFTEWVGRYRTPRLPRGMKLGDVATGDSWSATDAMKLGLVDEIGTSDEYIEQLKLSHVVVLVQPYQSKWDKRFLSLGDLSSKFGATLSSSVVAALDTFTRTTFRT